MTSEITDYKESFSPQENVINIHGDLVDTFFQVLEKNSLKNLLQFADYFPKFDLRDNIPQTAQLTEIYTIFSQFRKIQRDHGIELPDAISYRSINLKNMQDADQVIKRSAVDGGKSPTDTSVGVCVSEIGMVTTDKALKMAKVGLVQNNEPCVLFIYDSSKLQHLSDSEIAADKSLKFITGYGVKPKDGLSLSDALIGIIRLQNPGTRQHLSLS